MKMPRFPFFKRSSSQFLSPAKKCRKRPRRLSTEFGIQAYEQLESRQLLAIDFAGPGVPSDMVANAYLFIGDHSVSNSEIWSMTVGGKTITASGYGVVERVTAKFKRGESYSVSVSHVSSTISPPNYNYRAWIDRLANPTWTTGNPVPSSVDVFVTDPGQLFQRRHFGSSINSTIGKSATIHFPSIDLDVDSGNSGTLDRSLREDVIEANSLRGALLDMFNGDLDGDGIPDNFDFNGIAGAQFKEVKVSLSSNFAMLSGANQKVKFEFDDAGMTSSSNGLFRLWKKDAPANRTSADLIRSGIEYDAQSLGLQPGGTLTMYLEAVNPTRRTVHFDPIKVTTIVQSPVWSGSASDTIHVRRNRQEPTGCVLPHHPDGDFDAIDDVERFYERNLAAGGTRHISVMANDEYLKAFGSEYQLDITASGIGGIAQVLNPPVDYQYNWFSSASGSGTYEFGTFDVSLSFHSDMYFGGRARASWTGQLILSPDEGPSTTVNVAYTICMDRDYSSPTFGNTSGIIVDWSPEWYLNPNLINISAATSDGLLLTVEKYYGIGEIPTDSFRLEGEISNSLARILEVTQTSHGTAENLNYSVLYIPDPETTAKQDSFTYTLWNILGKTDIATVTIIADPDKISISAIDDEASEVPPYNLDYDTATFRVSRQSRQDDPSGIDRATIVFLTVSGRNNNGDLAPDIASMSDWQSSQLYINYYGQVGHRVLGDGTHDPVYAVVIPAGETFVDIVIKAMNDHDYELDERVVFTVVDEFFRYFDYQGYGMGGGHFVTNYEIEEGEAEITIIDKTANIYNDRFDEDLEDEPGIVIDYNHDDDNQNQMPDLYDRVVFVDDDLVEFKFSSLIPEDLDYSNDYFTLVFNESILRLWFYPDKSAGTDGVAEVGLQTVFDESLKDFSVWVEGVGLGNSQLSLVWHESTEPLHLTYVLDSLLIRSWGLDLDIDSDNNGAIENSPWEEHIESHSHALGKLIKQGAPQYTPVDIRLPAGLDPNEEADFLWFNFNIAGQSGIMKLWNYNHSIHLMPNAPYSLTNLGYNAISGLSTVYIELVLVHHTHWDKKGVDDFGKPDDRIRATWSRGFNGQNPIASDEVKYMFIEPNSFYDNLQNRREVRSAMAAAGVYEFRTGGSTPDMPQFALRALGHNEMKDDLGLPAELVHELGDGSNVEGFKAELYRDYVSGQYVLAFAGTGDFDDWLNNLWQGLGLDAPQYQMAMRIADNFARNGNLQNNFWAVGHSLGGGLASAAATVAGIQADTFNSAGLVRGSLIDANGFEIYSGSLARYDNAGSWINAYYLDWDILSFIQDSVPGIQNAIGNRIQMDGPVDFWMSLTLPNGAAGLALALAGGWTNGITFAAALTLMGPSAYYMGLAHSTQYYHYGLLVHENAFGVIDWDIYGYNFY
jgi:hypothetical protein